MTQEGQPEEKPDGERWLELLGYGHLKGQSSGYEIDGKEVPVEQFDLLCADYARPIFRALEAIDPNDPSYPRILNVARETFESYFGSQEPEA